MATAEQTFLRAELLERRSRLQTVEAADIAPLQKEQAASQIDAALARMDAGSFGVCLSCHTSVERDRLLQDPTIEVCLDCLSKEEQRALERDLALAARIQRGLLPRADVAPTGWHVRYHYQPAGVVSGDFCDLVDTKSGLLFLFGDVAGKGLAASMLMSHLHATFRTLADTEISLDRMVQLANRLFCESTLAGQYATLVVGRASSDGAVEMVSAGHLPVLHLKPSGAMPQPATSYPLGMFRSAEFVPVQLNLALGESLLLYTDGATETRNATDEEYGVHRLSDLATRCRSLSPDLLLENCLAELSRFSGTKKMSDDLTLLALQRVQ
jgi:sigma-B regulation protein RsbU (phosphoserine phosphatase)